MVSLEGYVYHRVLASLYLHTYPLAFSAFHTLLLLGVEYQIVCLLVDASRWSFDAMCCSGFNKLCQWFSN